MEMCGMDWSLDELLAPWFGDAVEAWLAYSLTGSVDGWLDSDPLHVEEVDRVTIVLSRSFGAQCREAGGLVPSLGDSVAATAARVVVEMMAEGQESRAIELISRHPHPARPVRLLTEVLALGQTLSQQ